MASKSTKRRRKRRKRQNAPGPGASGTPEEPAPKAEAKAAAPRPAPRRRRSIDDEPPPAPWGSFPLVEIAIFVGIVMLFLGLLVVGGQRGGILIITGLLLASIGGLELAVREHFAGFRSHTMILAGVPAAAVLGILFYAGPDGLPPVARAVIGVGVFGVAAFGLTRIFQSRSGGHAFKFGGLLRR